MNITEPAALLAHWQYRSQSLRRDRYDAETTRDRAQREAGKHKAIFDTADPAFSDLSALEDQIYQLKYLEAEADYNQYAIQAQISLDYFTPVLPERPLPLDLESYKRTKIFVNGMKLYDSVIHTVELKDDERCERGLVVLVTDATRYSDQSVDPHG